jgi:small-conductance mechanosensitive channel
MVTIPDAIRFLASEQVVAVVAVLILLFGIVVSYLAWRFTRQVLERAGLPEAAEGTLFDRTIRNFGLTTVGVLSLLVALFVYAGSVIVALNTAQLLQTGLWLHLTTLFPRVFVAALFIITGLIVGDKAGLVVSERLKSVKLPEITILPDLVKFSIYYVATLLALAELGIATTALLILLAAYAFGLILLSGLAFKDLLAAGAAGMYLLLTQPYGIGDEIEVDGHRGIVQEVDMFVTHIEDEDEEYIVPNQRVLKSGIVRVR